MQSTSDQYLNHHRLVDQEESLIDSLRLQPLIVVLRPGNSDLGSTPNEVLFFNLIESLVSAGVRHIECAWSSHPGWLIMMNEVKSSFGNVSVGVASVNSRQALDDVVGLKVAYAMAPCWNPELQNQALECRQLLVPGVFSPTEVHQACQYGSRIVKLFPASTLGKNYWSQLSAPLAPTPFVIAAGGLTVNDLSGWLNAGHDAVALGRGLIVGNTIDPALNDWLHQ